MNQDSESVHLTQEKPAFDNLMTLNEQSQVCKTNLLAMGSKESIDDCAESEDELIKTILVEKGNQRDHPPDIKCEDHVADLCFHPLDDLICAACMTGDVLIYRYSSERIDLISTLELHTRACRDIEFNEDGTLLYSTSKDKSIMITDLHTEKLKNYYPDAHEDAVHCLMVLNENIFASGDDSGTITLWDIRKRDKVFSMKEVDDYISCLLTNEEQKIIISSSGDGIISAFNITSGKLQTQSEQYDEDLSSMVLMKDESKLLVSSSKGNMFIFNWNEFGFHSDKFTATKHSINRLIPITEKIVVSACDDGIIRATHLFPHQHLGIVGQHKFSVDTLDISHDGTYIASSSYEEVVRFWNIRYFEDVQVSEKEKSRKKTLPRNLPSSKYKDASEFFSGLQ